MQQGIAVAGSSASKLSPLFPGEQQMPRGGQDSRDSFAFASFVVPNYVTGLIVQPANRRIGP